MSTPVPPPPTLLGAFGTFCKTIQSAIILIIVLLIAVVLWKIWLLFEEKLGATKAELAQAQQEIVELKDVNQRLMFANTLLKKQRQLAVISDVSAQKDEQGMLKTTFAFTEVDDRDQPISKPITYTIEGQELYIDTLIIKFEDRFIESNDAMRGASLCMIRRLFSSRQAPENGLMIQRESIPFVGNETDTNTKEAREFQQKMWLDFWKLASDPVEAQKAGIRAAQGTAVVQRIDPGRRYRLDVRNTGELTFVPINDPAPAPVTTPASDSVTPPAPDSVTPPASAPVTTPAPVVTTPPPAVQ